MLWLQPRTTGNSFFQLALSFEKSYLFTSSVLKLKRLKRALSAMMHQPTFQIFTYPWDTTIAPNSNTHSSLNKQTNNALILPKKLFENVYRPHCTVQAALQNCTTTVAHLELSLSNIICSINKMGQLYRMLILMAKH